MNQDELATLLFAAAQSRAASRGLRLGDGAHHQIRYFADQGASRILAQSPNADAATPVVSEAAKAFDRLIDEMASAASTIPGYESLHPNVIGEQTLAAAMSKLCPLFPIC